LGLLGTRILTAKGGAVAPKHGGGFIKLYDCGIRNNKYKIVRIMPLDCLAFLIRTLGTPWELC